MRLKNLLIVLLCFFSAQIVFAQNANLQVEITGVERNSYGDCTFCGDPDPTWKVTATDNGIGSPVAGPYCYHFDEDVNTFEAINSNNQVWTNNNTTATTFTLGLEGYERNCGNAFCTYTSYNFFTCSGVYGDSRHCTSSNVATVNFKASPPCVWNTGVSNFCGDYRIYYRFKWSFNYAPTIVTNPVGATLCLGNTTTLSVAAGNDPNGWNMGRNFQWQVSTSTACPGTGWTSISGANSSTYTPPQIGGTRLYRCLVTSNCNADFNSNTTISGCAVVTYNPIGAPGDPVPSIVSGICGSTVLPGSTNTLQAGTVLGLSGYLWTASGGSPTNQVGVSNTFNWTAPVNPGTYQINLTYVDACPQANAVAPTCQVTVGSPNCSFAYVSTAGTDNIFAGGPDVPYKTIAYAISQLGGRTKIRVASGTYNETVPLVMSNNLVIEGGYQVSGNIWTKSNSSPTVVSCSGTQVINGDVAHVVGFVSNGATGWELQDLNVTTVNTSSLTANNRGYSNYGVLAINNSTGFKINRCTIAAGNAARGADGTTPGGSGGAGGGGAGGGGGFGGRTGCNATGNGGGNGNAGNGGASGGGGGGACQSGGCNTVGCGSSSCTASNGGNGAAGATGAGYIANNRPATPTATGSYYVPGGQAASGSNGTGGGGGGGGGGGAGGTSCLCSQNGNANGGNGGAGGDGGLPGSGGFGGGGSFGIYAQGAATSGTLQSTQVTAGSAGAGGDGANGQPGASGSGGGGGNSFGGSCSPSGRGGNGGTGGNGGAGGRGQDGANGLANAIQLVGGATMTGSSTSVPNTNIIAINYQNAKACINSEISLSKNSGVWTFPGSLSLVNDQRDLPAGPASTSYNANSSPVVVYTTTPNAEITLTVNGINYDSYLKIASDNRTLPTITSVDTICVDGTLTASATHWNSPLQYEWIIYQGTSAGSPIFQSTLPNPTFDFTGQGTGSYIIRYKERDGCCGWSKPVFKKIVVVPLPIQFTVQGGGNYCPGGSGVSIQLSGSEPGVKYVLYTGGNAVDSIIGTGASPLPFNNLYTTVGAYTVVGTRFGTCGQSMIGFVNVGLSPTPTLFNVTGGGNVCPGATTGPSIFLDNSQVGVNYQLFLNGTTPVGSPVAGTGNQITFGQQATTGTYTVVGTFIASPFCSAKMNDSAVITVVALPTAYNVTGGGAYCSGDTGRSIGLSNTDVAVTYSLYLNGALVAGPLAGTGSAINFGTFTAAGTYSATATNIAGCTATMNDSVKVKILTLPTIIGVTTTPITCYGGNNGTITINAVSSNGNVFYSSDSGLTYSNSGSVTGLSPGSYYLYVRDDSSCVTRYIANPAQITQPLDIFLSVASFSDVLCNGDSSGYINLSASGGTAPFTFAWSNGATAQNISNLGVGSYTVTVTDGNGCQKTLTQAIAQPNAITDTIYGTPVSCAGAADGSVTFTISGGASPYTFLWSNGATTSSLTGLGAGLYSITATDHNGCKAVKSYNVTEPLPLSAIIKVTNISCFGASNDTVAVIVSGGNGGYTYQWSPPATGTASIITGVPAGQYFVTVTDSKGCSLVDSATITQPLSPLAVSAVTTPVACHNGTDGSITLYPSGGVGGYTYSWSSGQTTASINNLPSGTYTATVTDANGCAATSTTTFINPSTITSLIRRTNVSCNGARDGAITLTVSGGVAPYTFLWDNFAVTQNLSGLSGGLYRVIITDSLGCQHRDSIQVIEPLKLTATLTAVDVKCFGDSTGSITASASGGILIFSPTPASPTPVLHYNYQWSPLPAGINLPTQTGLPAGTYYVTVTDNNGCSFVDSIKVKQPNTPLLVVNNVAQITCAGAADGAISLTTSGGGGAYSYVWSTGASTPVISALGAGIYSCTITDNLGCVKVVADTLVDPTPITSSIVAGNVTCAGAADGTATLTVNGGVAPYTFLWDNFAATQNLGGVAGGLYRVIITDSRGCQHRDSVFITEPLPLVATMATTNVSCFGNNNGSLTVTVTGGTGTLTYQWSAPASSTTATASNLAPGTYTVTATDGNNCTATATGTISQPVSALSVNTSISEITCNGASNGSIILSVSGGTGAYTYLWSPGGQISSSLSGLSAGTYTATVTDANGCTATAAHTFTDPAAITSNIVGVNVSCAGANDGSATLTVGGGVGPYTFLWSNFSSAQSLSNIGGGWYYVIITDAHGCEHRDSVNITEPLPLTATAVGTNVTCFGAANGSITVTAAGGNGTLTYQWSAPATGTGPTVTGLVPGTYTVTVRDAGNCSATASATITQPLSGLLVLANVTNITCAGSTNGAISLSVSGGSPAYTFLWSGGQQTQSISGLTAGIYTATVTDVNGCSVVSTDTVRTPAAMTSSTVATNVTCAGANNGSATLAVNGGTAPYTFLWSNFSGSQNLTGVGGGTYYVVISDANGCTHRDSAIITEPLPINIVTTVSPITCYNDTNGAISLTVTGGTGVPANYTYSWSPTGQSTANIVNLRPGTYTVTVTDANGCTATATAQIQNPAPFVVTHVATSPRCYGLNDGSITLVVSGGSPQYSYNWSNFSTSQSQSSLFAGTYYATVTDSHGCRATDSVVLTDPNFFYVSNILQKNVSCAGSQDGNVIVTGYGGTPPYSYQWYYGLDTFGTPGPITQNFAQLSGGNYTVAVFDARGCYASITDSVQEPDSLKISLVKTDATCQSANSGAVAVVVTGGMKPYQFLWNNFVTDSVQNGIPGGNYAVVVTDSNGCHQNKSIAVNGQPDPMTANAAINNPTCGNSTNGFVVLDVHGGGAPYTYNWSTTPAQTGNTATGLTGGTYTYTITDTKGCQLIDSAVVVAPAPIVVSIGSQNATCLSSADGFAVVNVTGGVAPYTYVLGGMVQTSDTFRNLRPGSYQLVVRDVNGCENVSTWTVAAPTSFSVDLTADNTIILAGETVQFTATAVSDTTITAYVWTPVDSLIFTGCGDPNLCPTPTSGLYHTQTYSVTVVNARGCTVSDTITIQVSDHPSVFIPAAFTPNGDGLNDRFEFDILGSKITAVQIWNRWGEKVYDNPNQLNGIHQGGTNGWDGTFRDKGVEFDTYTYQISITYFDGQTEVKSGTVVVMK